MLVDAIVSSTGGSAVPFGYIFFVDDATPGRLVRLHELRRDRDQDVTFEASGDDQVSGSGPVSHFDSANQTLYFSSDGTQANAITVATLQSGVTLNPHDLIIV